MIYEMRCEQCRLVQDVDVPMDRRNERRECVCGGTMHRTYRGVHLCTQTAAEAFFGGKFWNGCNTAEKVAQMKAADRRYEASWQPDPNRPVQPGMTPLRPRS